MNADRVKARRSRLIRRGCILVWLFVIVFGIAALIPILRNYQRSEAMQATAINNESVIANPITATENATSTPVPPTPTVEVVVPSLTPSPTRCFPPAGWVPYVLTPQDDINLVAASVGLSPQELQSANCGADIFNAQAGDAIFLPYIPTSTAPPEQDMTPTETVISIIIINTNTPTPTLTPVPATATRYVPPTATKPPKSNPPTSRPPSTPPDSRP